MTHHTVLRLVSRRSTMAIAALSLFAGLVTIPSRAPATVVSGMCIPEHVSVAARVSSRPGGTTARLTITSKEFPYCRWATPTGYQFLDSNDAAIGPVVYPSSGSTTTTTSWFVLRYGFQVIADVTTMAGVNCTTQSASKVRLSVPGQSATRSVTLPSAIAVCVGGTTAWTSVTESRPSVPRCLARQLAFSLGPPSGAAGTSFYALRIRNTSSSACWVSGIPLVRALRATNGAPVGPLARRLTLNGNGTALRLSPGARASAALGVANAGNWPSASCAPALARALRVSMPGVSAVVPLTARVCTRVASLSVRGWVPGVSGQA